MRHLKLGECTIQDVVDAVIGLKKTDIELADEQIKYDSMYAVANNKIDENSHEIEMLNWLRPWLWPPKQSSPALVVGSGNGKGMRLLLENKIDTYGIDISRIASKYYEDMKGRFSVCQAHNMPFNDGVYKITLCVDVLEHIPPEYVDKTLEEIARVTDGVAAFQIGLMPSLGIKDMHLSLHDSDWWRSAIAKHFYPYGELSYEDHYVCLAES